MHRTNVSLLYAVLFDPNYCADIRGSRDLLDDSDVLRWVSPETYGELIHNNGGDKNPHWRYNLDHSQIEKFNHVPEIKRLVGII